MLPKAMNKDEDWEAVKTKGKVHFVLISSFYTALFWTTGYTLVNFISAYYRDRLPSSTSFSGIILDYFVEGIFWLFVFWIVIVLFLLLVWQNKEKS